MSAYYLFIVDSWCCLSVTFFKVRTWSLAFASNRNFPEKEEGLNKVFIEMQNEALAFLQKHLGFFIQITATLIQSKLYTDLLIQNSKKLHYTDFLQIFECFHWLPATHTYFVLNLWPTSIRYTYLYENAKKLLKGGVP